MKESQRATTAPPPNSNKLHHRTNILTESTLQIEWATKRSVGCGLDNKNHQNQCNNVCFMNAIIQCLSYAATFVRWLLEHSDTHRCKLFENLL